MKYMGSKARYTKSILPIILANRAPDQWYVEPFVGGANVIDKVSGPRIGADINPYLIALLEALRDGWIPPRLTRDEYNTIRADKGAHETCLVGWAGVGCSYSGKWFGGYAGTVQTRDGVRDYIAEAIANATRQAKGLAGAEFVSLSYDQITLPPSSLVYCDPPYADTTSYANTFDTPAFWEWCCHAVDAGHRVFVSEYRAPEDWCCVWEGRATSSLSANGKCGGNKVSTERLFTKG
jgi:DNA adenine methylase